MKNTLHTPNDIDVLLWYHTRTVDHERLHAPAVIEAANKFLDAGIFEASNSSSRSYCMTAKGVAFIEMLLNTPLPEMRWIDPRDESRGL
jgi:hypothetical protein